MLKQDAVEQVRERLKENLKGVEETTALVQAGQWQEAERRREPERLASFLARRRRGRVPSGAEAVQGPTNDIQRSAFLVEGAEVRRAVALVEVNDARASALGSGFLISPSLFITNNHVIRDADAARVATLRFDFELDKNGRPVPGTTYVLAPNRFFFTSPEEDLDFTIVALGELVTGDAGVQSLGFLPLSDASDKHALGIPLNIIQHPQGFTKMVTVRNNLLAERTDNTLLYETDTEVGSSGSPVFNDDWDVVALHHYGEPFRAKVDGGGQRPELNEGIRISSIVRVMRALMPGLPEEQRVLLEQALGAAAAAATGADLPVLTRGGAQPGLPEARVVSGAGAGRRLLVPASPRTDPLQPTTSLEIPMSTDATSSVRIVVPLEITVSLGAPGSGTLAVASAPVAAGPGAAGPASALTPPRIAKASEAKQLDTDYSNRRGYQAGFIPNFAVPAPGMSAKLTNDVAPLRATEENASEGVLLYEHFSVVLSRSKRIAIFTATNIDGTRYLSVDRDTGKVTGSEGETWYKDPRTSESFYLGQDFYSRWSHYFDRGHLTRRTDPTWGATNAEAERANADTFHFTNCSPQHFRFNQTATFWQGVERYVLENGLLQDDDRKRISVFQGPIFTNDDYFSDDIQIPSSFWKLVVWRGQNGPKAVGLVVDQSQLMTETRKNLGQPHDLPAVNVSHWRVSVADIERRTGLTFADAVRDADTIAQAGQPQVGEAARPLRGLSDLKSSSKPGTFA